MSIEAAKKSAELSFSQKSPMQGYRKLQLKFPTVPTLKIMQHGCCLARGWTEPKIPVCLNFDRICSNLSSSKIQAPPFYTDFQLFQCHRTSNQNRPPVAMILRCSYHELMALSRSHTGASLAGSAPIQEDFGSSIDSLGLGQCDATINKWRGTMRGRGAS